MRLLIVEDEADIVHALQRGLKNEGYAVDVAMDGEDALDFLSLNTYDLLVLDINLPKVDGFYILKKLREKDINTRVIIVSANREIEDRIKGLDLGANDYLVKPFDFLELTARIRALLRREFASKPSILKEGKLSIDVSKHKVTYDDIVLNLTLKEYSLLKIANKNKAETTICAMTVAIAAPSTPRPLKDPIPKINNGSNIILTIRPHVFM